MQQSFGYSRSGHHESLAIGSLLATQPGMLAALSTRM